MPPLDLYVFPNIVWIGIVKISCAGHTTATGKTRTLIQVCGEKSLLAVLRRNLERRAKLAYCKDRVRWGTFVFYKLFSRRQEHGISTTKTTDSSVFHILI